MSVTNVANVDSIRQMGETKLRKRSRSNVAAKDHNTETVKDSMGEPQNGYSDQTEERKFSDMPDEESHLSEKFVFVLGTVALMGLSHAAVWLQWILPAVFVIATPILLAIRIVAYWRIKWQFYLIDFCYFTMILTYIQLWMPDHGPMFQIVFALANGPLLAATAIYGNSVVYHRYDKMTSIYIHMLPALLTFGMRWYPVSTSWLLSNIRPISVCDSAPAFSFLWLYGVPFLTYFLHSVFYFLIVNVILCPKEPYWCSYTFLADKYKKILILSGPIGQGVMFYGMNLLFCSSTMLLALVSYNYFFFHCIFITTVLLVVLWNGGCYYVDVFSVKGFHDENDTG